MRKKRDMTAGGGLYMRGMKSVPVYAILVISTIIGVTFMTLNYCRPSIPQSAELIGPAPVETANLISPVPVKTAFYFGKPRSGPSVLFDIKPNAPALLIWDPQIFKWAMSPTGQWQMHAVLMKPQEPRYIIGAGETEVRRALMYNEVSPLA